MRVIEPGNATRDDIVGASVRRWRGSEVIAPTLAAIGMVAAAAILGGTVLALHMVLVVSAYCLGFSLGRGDA